MCDRATKRDLIEEFDPKYMNALFDLGYSLAQGGYPWQKLPPGYNPTSISNGG
jgi:hypothetical protein